MAFAREKMEVLPDWPLHGTCSSHELKDKKMNAVTCMSVAELTSNGLIEPSLDRRVLYLACWVWCNFQ